MMMNYLMTMLMGLRRRDDDYPNVDNMSYEELLALEERMGNVNRGLPKEKFDKIPVEKFSRYKFIDDKCIICQYEFKTNGNICIYFFFILIKKIIFIIFCQFVFGVLLNKMR